MAGSPPNHEGIFHWSKSHQVPENLQKYWFQRYHIFEQYDKGIWMTPDAWFGVTPESVANKIAAHIAESAPKSAKIIVDAFAGVGGNAIAFARSGRWDSVFAVEQDDKTLECLKHNAEIYGVANKIFWINGDCLKVLKQRFLGNDNVVIFGSPPWGGIEYGDQEVFDLSKMQPYNLDTLYKSYSKITREIVLYLPRNSDLNQIAEYAEEGKKLEVAHYAIKRASKALCVYFGNFDFELEEEDEEA